MVPKVPGDSGNSMGKSVLGWKREEGGTFRLRIGVFL
jgi:hypothetical protein